MNGTADLSLPDCGVAACGVLQAPAEAIAALRKQPGPPPKKPIPASLLRHADEQTVVGLAALLRAIDAAGWHDRDFRDWAVLGAPRYLGRTAMAIGISQYGQTGPRGVSPLTIPNCSLHALASTISLALGIHGPAFGVGGGRGHLAEGLLGAFSMQQEQRCPGVWLVLTSWEPYQQVDASGKMMAPAICHGVALALTAPDADLPRFQLRRIAGPELAVDPVLSELARFLDDPRPTPWQTTCGSDRLELSAA